MWCNGNTTDFDSVIVSSNLAGAAKREVSSTAELADVEEVYSVETVP